MISLDHTTRSDLITCPRKYYLRYIKNIQSVKGSTALRYGIAWHGAMEGFYTEIAENGWTSMTAAIRRAAELAQKEWNKVTVKYDYEDEDYRSLENLMQAFMKYLDHFSHDEGMLRIIEPERVFKIKMTPTRFEKEKFPGVEPFYFTGRIDLTVELNGRPWIMEHKTTSRPLTLQVANLHRSPQLMGYNYAAKSTSVLNEIPDGSLVTFHQITAYRSRTSGKYGEAKFDFARSPQIFSIDDLANWRLSFVADAYSLQQMFRNDVFPMRHHSCYSMGACPYVALCEQNKLEPSTYYRYFIDDDPWDVTKLPGEEHKLTVVDDVPDKWEEIEMRVAT